MQTRVFKCANMPYHNLALTILCFSVIASFLEPSCTASHHSAGHTKVNSFYSFIYYMLKMNKMIISFDRNYIGRLYK